jgi:hypothetical protein
LSKQARGKMLTAAAMLVVAGLSTAQAADTTLTLACQGTVRIDDWSYRRAGQPQDTKPEPYSMGMTVNLTAHTVQGFGSNYPYKITDINAGTIIFGHFGETNGHRRPDRSRDRRPGGDDYILVRRAKARHLKRAIL